MTSATDIITYIGVPLAVLGVLPILYTFAFGILTQRRIRASLVHYGHRPLSNTRPNDGFTIRSSPMTSLIEVELPRYTIAPLERNSDDYWQTSEWGSEGGREHHGLLERAESTLSMVEEGRVRGFLRGGSWRAFQWKKLIVGRKLYRIQYEDELREPPAEIDFSDLVHFLLDWGAVPDAMGWEKLRSGGLWTPSGTILLRKVQDDSEQKNRHIDWVLRTSVPDESDGVLSLTIRWTRDVESMSGVRGAASLPPGWGRLTQPSLLEEKEKVMKERKDLSARIEELKDASKYSVDSTSFRFRVEDGRVQHVLWEAENIETGSDSSPFHTHERSSAGLWFTCGASTLLSQRNTAGGLWGFDLPSDIVTFVRKDTVPCGMMVYFTLLPETDAPQWTSESHSSSASPNSATQFHNRFLAEKAAERLEATMSPEQARMHRMNRLVEQRRLAQSDMMDSMRQRQEREERRIKDAIASPRMSNKAVAEACLAWLIQQGEVGREWTLEMLAEAVLYLIAVDHSRSSPQDESESEGTKVIKVLEEWMSWSLAGGMKKQQFHLLEGMKVEFCFAAALVAVVQAASATHTGKASVDMLECLRLWRKVRLG